MSSRALSAPPRESKLDRIARRISTKLDRIARRISTKQYRFVGPFVKHPPVWVGKKRPAFNGSRPASDLLRAYSRRGRFVKKLLRRI